MGGSGSGNHYHWWRRSKKTTVEQCLSLDVTRWTRQGSLQAGTSTSGTWTWTYASGNCFKVNYDVVAFDPTDAFIRLYYSFIWTATQKRETLDYRVRLTTTRPRRGGLRWWFICPLVVNGQECGCRVGKLYLPPEGRYFGCRHCYDLTYASCQQSRKYTSLYRQLARETGRDLETVKRLVKRMGQRRLE
jgi:hypothetical protein